MKRILVLGICGAGKSTFARKLQAKLGLPIYHLDQIFWTPGWKSISKDDLRTQVEAIVKHEEWIIDGGYLSCIHERLARADTVILLGLSRYRALWRIIKRVVRYHGTTRPDMTEGCPEQIDWEFVKYVWNFPTNQALQTEVALKQYPDLSVIRLKGDRATKKWLDQL